MSYIKNIIPTGGSTNQVFSKASGSNFDVQWSTGGGGGTPGGSSGQMQYNNGGSFGGADVTYDSTLKRIGIQDSSPGAAFDVTSAQNETQGDASGGSSSHAVVSGLLGNITGSAATQALGRLMRPTGLSATVNLAGTAYTEASGSKTFQLYSYDGANYSQLYAEVVTDAVAMPPTPSNFGGSANTGVTGFNAGDQVDYQLYAYKTIAATRFYTPTGASIGPLSDGGSNFGCDLSWDDMSMEGYVLLRQVNGSGFNNGVDLGNVTSYQDTGFADTATTVTPNTIAYSWDLVWTASPNGATSYKLLEGGRGLDVGNVTSYTDDGFADTDTTVTPTLTDFVANNTTYNFVAYAYAQSPSDTTYYNDTGESYSLTDDGSGETFTINHVVGTIDAGTPAGYKVVWTNDSKSYTDADGSFTQYSGSFTSPDGTVTPTASNIGFLNDGSTAVNYNVYAYRTVNGTTIYSSTPVSLSIADENDNQKYYNSLSWTAGPGADGYKITRDVPSSSGVTTTSTSFVSDSLESWAAGTTITPTTYLSPATRSVKAATSFTADEPQHVIQTTSESTPKAFMEFRGVSGNTMGFMGADGSKVYHGVTYASKAMEYDTNRITTSLPISVAGGSGTTQFYNSGTSAATNGVVVSTALCTVGTTNGGFTNQPTLAMQQVGSPTSAAHLMLMYNSSGTLKSYTDYQFKSFYESMNIKCGSSSTYAKVGGQISINTTAVGNVGSGEDNLMSYSIPANMLATNGDLVEFEGTLTFAANGNNKRVKVKYGATTIYDSTALALNTGTLTIRGRIIRTGSSAEVITGIVSSSNALIANAPFYSTASEATSSSKTLQFTGEATSNDDISQKVLIVKFNPNNT